MSVKAGQAQLAGCSHRTVARYVAAREQGQVPGGPPARRPGVIDPFLPKLEELVERSHGKIRADVACETITAMGYAGSERTTRRAVALLKANRAAAAAGVPAANAPRQPAQQHVEAIDIRRPAAGRAVCARAVLARFCPGNWFRGPDG